MMPLLMASCFVKVNFACESGIEGDLNPAER